MAQDIKEAQLMQSRLKEVQEASKSIANRVELLKKTELELERAIAKRDDELQKMKDEHSSEIERLKLEIASTKNNLFALAHNLKVVINKLKTVARTKELEEFREKLKKWSPFNKATKMQAEHIVKEMLEKI